MNIYDPYPESVEVNGVTYALDLAFDNVLRVIDAEDIPELTPEDKIEYQCALLLKNGYKDMPAETTQRIALISAVFDLFKKDTEEKEKQSERFIDFHQDAALIRTAFFRMGVDLLRDKIHFCQFMELLADIPTDTALYRTIDIRQRPIPKPTKDNAEQIAALQKAKARVAIKVSEDERRRRFADSLKNINALRG
jgi:hypothetical protein